MHGSQIQFFAIPFKERLKPGEPRKRPKQSYVPQNWSEYNKSLRKRGMLSLYLPKGDLGSQLINDESYKKGQSGREQVYTPAYVNLLFMLYRMHRMGSSGLGLLLTEVGMLHSHIT